MCRLVPGMPRSITVTVWPARSKMMVRCFTKNPKQPTSSKIAIPARMKPGTIMPLLK